MTKKKKLSQTKHSPTRTAFHFPHAAPIPYTLTASSVKASANKGTGSECGQQSPHQVGRAGPGRSRSLHLLGQCRRQARWYRRRCKSKNRQGTSSVFATKEHLEFKGTVSENQSSTVQHQPQGFKPCFNRNWQNIPEYSEKSGIG